MLSSFSDVVVDFIAITVEFILNGLKCWAWHCFFLGCSKDTSVRGANEILDGEWLVPQSIFFSFFLREARRIFIQTFFNEIRCRIKPLVLQPHLGCATLGWIFFLGGRWGKGSCQEDNSPLALLAKALDFALPPGPFP